jgi:ferric-dicitrate binding protein FerR (iron transport regulator)
MNSSEYDPRPEGPDRIEQLLRNAAARERPSAADEQAIREALRAEWLAATRRSRWRRAGWVAAGAAALLVLAVVTVERPSSTPETTGAGERLAQVEAATGRVRVGPGGDAGPTVAQAGTALHAGQEIATAEATRLALRWRDGSSVRIDERTTLRLTAAGEAELIRGRMYVDAGASAAAADAPVILTPAGPIRHLGTQYMVSVDWAGMDAESTRISVREGRVALTGDGAPRTASSGQELSVDRDGQHSLRPIPAWGEDWRWAESLAAPFAAEGQSMADFLAWVGRETGRRVEFTTAAAEERARTTELHGAIELEPLRALQLVLQTSDLAASVDNGIIRVRLSSGE